MYNGAECRIMGIDAGTKNLGYSVIKARMFNGQLQFKVLACGACPCPVNDMKAAGDLLPVFMHWVHTVRKTHDVQYMIGERFIVRPGGSSAGISCEAISLMYGALLHRYKQLTLTSAATWKNAVRRIGIDLKAWYKDKRYCGSNHELDATLQAIHEAHRIFGLQTSQYYATISVKSVSLAIHAVSTNTDTQVRVAKRKQEKA